MSVQAITWAYQQVNISTGAKFLLVTLANYSDYKYTSWPGQERLARDLASNSRTIRRWTSELVEKGLLTTTNRAGNGQGRQTIIYQLMAGQPDTVSAIDDEATGHCVRGQPDIYDRQPDTVSANTKENLKIDTKDSWTKSKKKKNDYTPAFEFAWSAYPKRQGGNPKPDALKAWNARRREGHTPEEIIAGVERYAAFVKTTGKERTEYIMQAKRFFGTGKHFCEEWKVERKPAKSRRLTTATDIATEFQRQLGRAPPVGKTAEECQAILARETGRQDTNEKWWLQ